MPNWVEVPSDWELYQQDMEELSRFWYDDWVDKMESDEAGKST